MTARSAQSFERGLVMRDPPRLDQRHGVDGDAEPVEVLADAGDELGAAAAGIKILDPQQESCRGGAADGGAIRVAKVEPARR